MEVVDSTGVTVASGTSDSSGAYSFSISKTAVPPFFIRASGVIGDSVASLYSVATEAGTANVSQVTTAIVATMSPTGNPSDIFNNPSKSGVDASKINRIDEAYTAAFSNLLMGIVNSSKVSFLETIHSSGIDRVLDNIKIQVKQSGDIILATSSGLMTTDAGNSVSTASQTQSLLLAKGVAPGNNASNYLLASGNQISVNDLENLRSAFEECFSIKSVNRGTSDNPIAACADGRFVVSSDPSIVDGFRHSGWRWTNAISSFNIHPFYTGIFGTLLSRSLYDDAKFLKPKIIRPLDSRGDKWVVMFPMLLSDGSLTSIGDIGIAKYLVVKKISNLVSEKDSGYRIIGDQRDYSAVLTPTIQKMTFGSTSAFQTGLYSVFKVYSSTDPISRKAVMANIQGKGLPPNGIFMGANVSQCGVQSNATMTHSFLSQFEDGTPTEITYDELQNNSGTLNWSNMKSKAPVCTSVFRMAEANQNESGAISLKSWGSDGRPISAGVNDNFQFLGTSTSAGNWLSDVDLSSIQFDEPCKIKIWFDDGSNLSYINRLPTSVLTLAESVSYPSYPDFSTETKNSIRSFVGANDFKIQILANPDLYTYQAGIFWNNAVNFTINGLPASTNGISTTIACQNSSSCNTGDWSPGRGFVKAFSRTTDSLTVSHIFMNN